MMNTSPAAWQSHQTCFANCSHAGYRSGFGLINQSEFSVGAAFTRYGGIVDRSDAFRSMHVHAVSSTGPLPVYQLAFQSAGQPLQADGTIRVGPAGGTGGVASSSVTPCGSPGLTLGGPTVPGVAVTGSFPFGISGGRIERVKRPTVQAL